MMVADIFVILDTVQFNPRHEENRTKIKSESGPRWLTVPVRQNGREQKICETYIDRTQPWARKAVGTLSTLYHAAPYYKTYGPEITRILESPHETLTEITQASWQPALQLLGVTCRFLYASELQVSGKGSRLLLEICKSLGADTYLSGAFGREYLDVSEFAAEGIGVRFADYSYPVYPQRFNGFVPFLSYLDTLFNDDLCRDRVMAGGRMLPSN
jgi:hypothetical protein